MRNLRPLAALILVAPLAAQTVVIQPAPGARATETRTVGLAAGAPLRVSNVNGRIRVTGWDRAEVEFTGAFKPGRGGEQVKVVLEPRQGGLEVRGEYPKNGNNGPECQMELKVPRSALSSLETVNGSLEVREVSGKVAVKTVNGEITLELLGGGLKAETVNGSIRGSGIGDQVEARTVNGDIRLSTKGLKGRLEAKTLNGTLKIKGEGATDVQVSKRHMGATFGGGDRPLRLETLNGDITLD